jgi:Leucine-rich repeat (LRR) protein
MSWCRVQDISPLKGSPLEELYASHNQIQNLAPLKGMALKVLDINSCPVKDLRPLQGMPLERLDIERCPINDMSSILPIVKGMPIRRLSISGIADLRVLQGLALTELYVDGTFKDLHPLADMPLKFLDINSPSPKDLKGIETLPLESLSIRSPGLSDIAAIQGTPLKRLRLYSSSVSDISVLKDMSKLQSVDITGSRVTDVGVLAYCQALEEITIPMQAKNVQGLKDLPNLQKIGYSSSSLQSPDWFFRNTEGRKH